MTFIGVLNKPKIENPEEEVSCESCRLKTTQAKYAEALKNRKLAFFSLKVDDELLAQNLCTVCFSSTIKLLTSEKQVEIEIITHPGENIQSVKHVLHF